MGENYSFTVTFLKSDIENFFEKEGETLLEGEWRVICSLLESAVYGYIDNDYSDHLWDAFRWVADRREPPKETE